MVRSIPLPVLDGPQEYFPPIFDWEVPPEMEPVTLTTERLRLRPLGPDDAEAVHQACQDPEITRWTAVPCPYRKEHADSFVGSISPEGWRNETLLNFGSFCRATDRFISSIGLVGLTELHTAKIAEIGYWTVKEHRSRGYTVEAVAAVARWCFHSLGVERLEWLAEVGNTASRAVAEKVGFRIEGTLRSRILHRGIRRDAWIGALLPSDLGLTTHHAYMPAARSVTDQHPGQVAGAPTAPSPPAPPSRPPSSPRRNSTSGALSKGSADGQGAQEVSGT